MSFKNALDNMLGELNVSKSEFGRLVGVDAARIYIWEKGDICPSLGMMAQMSKKLNVTFEIDGDDVRVIKNL